MEKAQPNSSAHVCTIKGDDAQTANADKQQMAAAQNSAALRHHEIHQALKSCAVDGPIFSTREGFRSIVIEVNARQVVITAIADVNSIFSCQGSLELESAGASFVISPLVSLPADRFVVAVQGEITTIAQTLQAIGQQSATNGVCHGEAPSQLKAAILCAPAGCGKSRIAAVLAKALGLSQVIDEWNPSHPITECALHVTNTAPKVVSEDVAVIKLH